MLPVESSPSSIIFDDVEEHDSEDSFFCGETDTITKDTRTTHGQKLTRLIATNATDEWMVKKTDKQNRLYEQAQFTLSILSDCRSSLRYINANQHLSTGLSWQNQLLELTEIILKYLSMMQHYNAVHFDRAIQRWILSLPIYIMNSWYNIQHNRATRGRLNNHCNNNGLFGMNGD